MTRRRVLTATIPGIAAAAAALGFVVSSAPASTGHNTVAKHPAAASAKASAQPAGVPKVYDCTKPQVRPGSFTLACADGNSVLSRLSWSSWNGTSAHGTGTQQVNDCVPYCAAGKFRSYPADVTFWRSEPVPGHPSQRYFSRVTLEYTGARPPVFSGGKQVAGPTTWTGALATTLTIKPAQPN